MENTNVLDVAKYFLSQNFNDLTPKKLQKLCYYAYAWNLALRDEKIFDDKFQAWVHGPVSPTLYHEYKEHGWKPIPKIDEIVEFDKPTEEVLEAVIETYGSFTGDELEDLTHEEKPWLEARMDLAPYQPSNRELDDDTIKDFYLKAYERGQND